MFDHKWSIVPNAKLRIPFRGLIIIEIQIGSHTASKIHEVIWLDIIIVDRKHQIKDHIQCHC